jgi:hypothetical protein
LAFVVASIVAGHAEPFHAISEKDLRARVVRLDAAIPNLQRPEIIIEIAKLVAAVGDGHTRFPWPWDQHELGFHQLPLRVEAFSDGWFVTAASAPYRALVGCRIESIGSASIEQVITRITPLISRDNPNGVLRLAPRLLVIPEILEAVGVVQSSKSVSFIVKRPGGKTLKMSVVAAGPADDVHLLDLHRWNGTRPPLHRSNPEAFYWRTLVPGTDVLYAEVNAVSNQPDHEKLPAFCASLLHDLDQGMAQRVVIDLRHNGGGSRELMQPCVEGLAARTAINRADHLFVVIGHETFSAALWTALDFANRTKATLIGMPTAGRPNFFGETNGAETPHSHIHFTWATRMNWRTDPSDHNLALTPATVIDESFEDYAAGRDPVMEVVKRR